MPAQDDQQAVDALTFPMITVRAGADECAGYMKQGVIVIVVKDGEKGDNPYRTGGFFVIKEEAAKGMFPSIGDSRVMFIEETAAKMVGLIKNA